jgi:hypothetical protein
MEGLSLETVVRDENYQILKTEILTWISLVTIILWKVLKYSVKIRGVLDEVRTVHLANTSRKRKRLSEIDTRSNEDFK